ncbi:MAG TPA: RES family NAD+ phosphorylase [Thermoanaerobaculia bacterium]|nr:RES family NAD+ phosphorylase [Thermoanaerobaculia bacterium]
MPPAPAPPADPKELDPATVTLPAGSVLFRVHPERLAATAFNPGHGEGARFHFVDDGSGGTVPSLYAAETRATAIAETVFHDVPLRPRGDRRVSSWKLRGRMLSSFRTRRGLSLVQLHHPGLGRLGLEPGELTATDPSEYARTREWAQALHRHGGHEGLVWVSRLHNTGRAYTFFGDRVSAGALEARGDSLPLFEPPGLEVVYELAEAYGITIVHG